MDQVHTLREQTNDRTDRDGDRNRIETKARDETNQKHTELRSRSLGHCVQKAETIIVVGVMIGRREVAREFITSSSK